MKFITFSTSGSLLLSLPLAVSPPYKAPLIRGVLGTACDYCPVAFIASLALAATKALLIPIRCARSEGPHILFSGLGGTMRRPLGVNFWALASGVVLLPAASPAVAKARPKRAPRGPLLIAAIPAPSFRALRGA